MAVTATPESVDLLGKVQALVKDVSAKLSAADWSQAIADALKRYSKHRPLEATVDVTGDGTNDYPVANISGWVEGFSEPRQIEYPVDDVPADLLDEDEYELYRKTTGRVIRLINDTPEATETFRVTFTIPVIESTIPAQDVDAVAQMAASIALGMLAARYLDASDPSVAADVVNYRSKSQEAASMAKFYLNQYKQHLGLKDEDTVAPASAIGQQAPGYPGGGERLTHNRKDRRRRWSS